MRSARTPAGGALVAILAGTAGDAPRKALGSQPASGRDPGIREPGPTQLHRLCPGLRRFRGRGARAQRDSYSAPAKPASRHLLAGREGRRWPRYGPAPAAHAPCAPPRRAPPPGRSRSARAPAAAESGGVRAAGPLTRAPGAGAALWFRCRQLAGGLMSPRHAPRAGGPAPRGPLVAALASPPKLLGFISGSGRGEPAGVCVWQGAAEICEAAPG